MLITLFLNLAYYVVSAFLSLFPTANISFMDNISNSITMTSGYLSAVNNFLPMTTLFIIVGLFIAVEIIVLLIKIINWIIRKIPTIS